MRILGGCWGFLTRDTCRIWIPCRVRERGHMTIPDIWLKRSRERESTLRSLPSRATWLGPVSLSTSRNSCCAFLRLGVSRPSLEHMCFESQSLNLYFPLSQSVQNKNRYYINHQSHVILWKFPNTKQKPVEKTALGFPYIHLNSCGSSKRNYD